MVTLFVILASVGGLVAGFFLCIWVMAACSTFGVLMLDETDPNVDKYRFVCDDISELKKKNVVIMKVKRGPLEEEQNDIG